MFVERFCTAALVLMLTAYEAANTKLPSCWKCNRARTSFLPIVADSGAQLAGTRCPALHVKVKPLTSGYFKVKQSLSGTKYNVKGKIKAQAGLINYQLN